MLSRNCAHSSEVTTPIGLAVPKYSESWIASWSPSLQLMMYVDAMRSAALPRQPLA